MSVDLYLGGRVEELRLKKGDVASAGADAEVLAGRASVEEAREKSVRRVPRPTYKNVGQYDAVLRAHCRLDGEG